MKLSEFDYSLPEELIAQTPLKQRDTSRLLVLDRKNNKILHKHFYNIIDYLDKGDTLVLNNTKVIPARLFGTNTATDGVMEFLLLKRLKENDWECLAKPARRAKIGNTYKFGDELSCEIIDNLGDGKVIASFNYNGIWEEILDRLGQMPLPPYIKEKLEDKDRYNTVYSKISGSAAAPTAGLHWTPELLDKVRAKGVNIAEITLHVGLGTFRPVQTDDILDHNMHSEYYEIDEKNADIIKNTTGKIIANGTTAVRVLETIGNDMKATSGWTDIFIYPPYEFKNVDSLITNFHLPKSTLLMLVSAFADRDFILKAYNEAIENKYRFFSFGDAMVII